MRFGWSIVSVAFALAGCAGGNNLSSLPSPPRPGGPSGSTGPAIGTAIPGHFTVSDLGANVEPLHINSRGAIVGDIRTANSLMPFVWNSGTMQQMQPLSGYPQAIAYWINDSGEIVGTSYNNASSQMNRATRFLPGSASADLGAPADNPDSAAYSINNAGLIVGGAAPLGYTGTTWSGVTIFDGTGNASFAQGQSGGEAYAVNDGGAFVGANCCPYGFPNRATEAFKAPPFTLLWNTPGNDNQASDINEAGDIVGYFSGGSGSGAIADGWILRSNGTVTEIDAPGIATGPGTLRASAVNDNDWVVGTFTGQSFSGNHAFIYQSKVVDLNTLLPTNCNWVLETASSINVNGQIVGTGSVNGVEHGYLLTPSP